jgi:SulP family sulfate permease
MEIGLVFANVNEQPLSLMRRGGFEAVIGAENIVPTVAEAVGVSG